MGQLKTCSSLCHPDEPCLLTENGQCGVNTEDPDQDPAYDEETEPFCTMCNGPIYSQPHWSYWKCDDCGHTGKKEQMEP